MGGEFTYPKLGSQNGFDNHSHMSKRAPQTGLELQDTAGAAGSYAKGFGSRSSSRTTNPFWIWVKRTRAARCCGCTRNPFLAPRNETMVETIAFWYLQGNHHSWFLRWCKIASIHSILSALTFSLKTPQEATALSSRLFVSGQVHKICHLDQPIRGLVQTGGF